jgi:hypothetical protein
MMNALEQNENQLMGRPRQIAVAANANAQHEGPDSRALALLSGTVVARRVPRWRSAR